MLGISLQTKSGRYSDSQIWQFAALILQSINVSVLMAFGVPAEYMAIAVFLLQVISGWVAMRLRTVTDEAMKQP